MAEGIMVDFWRDFRIRETGTVQQVAQLHDRYMMMMMMMMMTVRVERTNNLDALTKITLNININDKREDKRTY